MYFVVPLDVEETDGKESPWLAQNDEEQVEAQESRTLRSRCKRKSDTLSSPPCAAAEQVAFPQVLVVLNIASCGWGLTGEQNTHQNQGEKPATVRNTEAFHSANLRSHAKAFVARRFKPGDEFVQQDGAPFDLTAR